MMLTRRNGTTIRNIPRVDPGARQPSRVAVTVTRLEDSSRVALSIGSDATTLVRSYDIPLSQFLQLVAAVVTADDLACAGIAPELASRAAVPAATAATELVALDPAGKMPRSSWRASRWRARTGRAGCRARTGVGNAWLSDCARWGRWPRTRCRADGRDL
jgi:hypothetical protein